MFSQGIHNQLRQIRTDELCGAKVHLCRRNKLVPLSRLVDILAVIVPVLYFAPKILAGQSADAAKVVQGIDTVLTVALLAAVIAKFIMRIDDRVQAHLTHAAESTQKANEALRLLMDGAATDETAMQFISYAKAPNRNDMDLLADATTAEKQEAYRAALQEFMPGTQDAVCTVCGASPWKYKAGACQICGGTPTNDREGKEETHHG